MPILVYVYGLVGACFLGLGFVLQQEAAARAPIADILTFRLLLDLMRVPRWLCGIGFMVIGQLLSALALSQGDVSRVAPLLATNLLFAMALARRISGQRLGRSGWAGVLLLSGGVAAFVAAGSPQGSEDAQIGVLRRWLVLGSVVAVALVMVVIARHLRLAEEPPLLAGAAGVLYGLQDALTRESSTVLDKSGITGLVTTWQPYVVVTVGRHRASARTERLRGRAAAAVPAVAHGGGAAGRDRVRHRFPRRHRARHADGAGRGDLRPGGGGRRRLPARAASGHALRDRKSAHPRAGSRRQRAAAALNGAVRALRSMRRPG